MRQIQKRNEPDNLTHWRLAYRNDPNFSYSLIDAGLRQEIRQALVIEQRGLCAYTGRRIDEANCHIEHMRPRMHCGKGEDVSYGNMLACVPAPNASRLPYGAHRKGSWPDPTQEHLFVSPLRNACGPRFSFTFRGRVSPSNPQDQAARETIDRLGLDHPLLRQFRKAAIDGTLRVRGSGGPLLDLRSARRRLGGLNATEQGNGPLEPYSFVLQHALTKHIGRIQAIRANRARQL